MNVDHAKQGKANRDKGARAERTVVSWFRVNGWPHAERSIATGHRSGDRVRADHGDITGMPGIAVQVKDVTKLDEPAKLGAALTETDCQRAATKADYGLLIQRRRGVADAGRWWVWLRVGDVVSLGHGEEDPAHWRSMHAPVRMELRHLVPLLLSAGYGTPSEELK